MPVMEGKALLFKEFGGVDAWPICLATKDPDEIVSICKAIAPGFGGINLEDISAPRCFEIERRLRDELDIPVFHDDQHGTAVVVLAALLNALRVVGKRLEDVKIVNTGVGAAGIATMDVLLAAGARNVVGCDHEGAVYRGRPGLPDHKAAFAERTNPDGDCGSADEALAGADVFVGLSVPGAVSADAVKEVAKDAIVFAAAARSWTSRPRCSCAAMSTASAGRRSPRCTGTASTTAGRRAIGGPRCTTATDCRYGPAPASASGARS